MIREFLPIVGYFLTGAVLYIIFCYLSIRRDLKKTGRVHPDSTFEFENLIVTMAFWPMMLIALGAVMICEFIGNLFQQFKLKDRINAKLIAIAKNKNT